MAIMTKHSDCDKADIGDNPLVEKPSRPKPIRDTSASSLPASAPSSGGGGGAGRRAQMMRSMRNLNRAAGASSDPRQHQEQPRRSSTGDARKAFGGALIGQERQRGKNFDNDNGSNSMPNLYQENADTGRDRANTGTSNTGSSKRGIRPVSTGSRSNETSARSLQSSAMSSSRRDMIVQELHRSESGRHVVDSPSNNTGVTDQHSMFEEASRRRAERAAARRRSQEGQAGMIDNDLQAQLAQANGGGGGSESRRTSMGSRISSMSSASDLSSPVGGAGSRRRSGDHIRRSMDLSHVALAASGSGRKGSMSHGLRPQCSARSLNTSASAMSAVSNASSTLISEQPVVEEEFSRLRLQMSSQQQPQSHARPSASAAAAASSSTMDDDERLARELQEQYDRESRATHEGGHGLDMTELYDGTRLMVVNRNSMGHGSVGGGGGGASGSGSDRRVLCAGCNGRFRVSSGCELLMCPKCDTLTPV